MITAVNNVSVSLLGFKRLPLEDTVFNEGVLTRLEKDLRD